MPERDSVRPRPYARPEALVVGAGPVGCLIAGILARHGYQVVVCEQRPHFIEKGIAEEGRTINLSLSPRGMSVLIAQGCAVHLKDFVVGMGARVVHPRHGSARRTAYGKPEWQNFSVSRRELNRVLMRDAVNRPNVHIEFDMRCAAIDFTRREAKFVTRQEGEIYISYDLLVGADGATSQVRNELSRQGLTQSRLRRLNATYKEFELRSGAGMAESDWAAIHVWPRNGFFLVALPNVDGSLRATLVISDGHAEHFSKLLTSAALTAFFRRHFPDSVESLRPVTEREALRRPAPLLTASCSALTYQDSVLLVGDAAHTVAPFLGQGINLGFEDCGVLDQLLSAPSHSLSDLLRDYGQRRKQAGDAASDLSLANFAELTEVRRLRTGTPLPVLVNFLGLSYEEVLRRYSGGSGLYR
ncbi:NAD(P)/FAD-dependent oxidoreductase [Streptomyces roseifaciens]